MAEHSTLQTEIDEAIRQIAERLYDEMKAPKNTGEARRFIATALSEVRVATATAIMKQLAGLLQHAALEGMSVRRVARGDTYYIYDAAGSREFIAETIARRMMVPDDPSRQLVER